MLDLLPGLVWVFGISHQAPLDKSTKTPKNPENPTGLRILVEVLFWKDPGFSEPWVAVVLIFQASIPMKVSMTGHLIHVYIYEFKYPLVIFRNIYLNSGYK